MSGSGSLGKIKRSCIILFELGITVEAMTFYFWACSSRILFAWAMMSSNSAMSELGADPAIFCILIICRCFYFCICINSYFRFPKNVPFAETYCTPRGRTGSFSSKVSDDSRLCPCRYELSEFNPLWVRDILIVLFVFLYYYDFKCDYAYLIFP